MSQNYEETHCKSCGRFVGALEVCPFCRNFNPKRLSVRLIKYLTPIISVLGLFVLHYIGVHYGNPEVKLDTLTKRSNFAQVTTNAVVNAPLRYYAASDKGENAGGSVEFEIDDGTSLMLVRCYDDATRELVEAGKLPAFGDKIKMTASFQYKGKGGFLILGSEKGIKIDRRTPETASPIKTVNENPDDKFKRGDILKVSGRVASVDSSRYELEIDLDAGGATDETRITAVMPFSVLQAGRHVKENADEWKDAPRKGDFITLSGALELRGKKDDKYFVIVLPSAESIVKASEDIVKKDNMM
jgi:hypothetical protein